VFFFFFFPGINTVKDTDKGFALLKQAADKGYSIAVST